MLSYASVYMHVKYTFKMGRAKGIQVRKTYRLWCRYNVIGVFEPAAPAFGMSPTISIRIIHFRIGIDSGKYTCEIHV